MTGEKAPLVGVDRCPPSRREWAALAVIVLFGALIRGHALGEPSLWGDEAISVVLGHYRYRDLFMVPVDPTPGLYYAVQKAWMWAGTDPLIVRLPAYLFGVLTTPAVFALAYRLHGATAALVAALLAALIPEWVHYSQEARAYSLLLLLAVLGLLALVIGLERPAGPSGRPLFAAGLIAVAMIYTHPVAWFLIAPLGLWALWRVWGRIPRRILLLSIGLLAVLTLPEIWRAVQIAQNGQFSWLRPPTLSDFTLLLARLAGPWPSLFDPRVLMMRDADPAQFQLAEKAVLALTICAVAAALMRAVIPVERAKSPSAPIIVMVGLIFPGLLFVFAALKPLIMVRTMLPFQLGLVLLVSLAATRRGGVWIGALFAGFFAVELAMYPPPPPKNDWREIARTVADVDPQGGVLICPYWHSVAYAYALDDVEGERPAPALWAMRGDQVILISEEGKATNKVPKAYFYAFMSSPQGGEFHDPMAAASLSGRDMVVVSQCDQRQMGRLRSYFAPARLKKVPFDNATVTTLEMFSTR